MKWAYQAWALATKRSSMPTERKSTPIKLTHLRSAIRFSRRPVTSRQIRTCPGGTCTALLTRHRPPFQPASRTPSSRTLATHRRTDTRLLWMLCSQLPLSPRRVLNKLKNRLRTHMQARLSKLANLQQNDWIINCVWLQRCGWSDSCRA